jgi:hypothetical protein
MFALATFSAWEGFTRQRRIDRLSVYRNFQLANIAKSSEHEEMQKNSSPAWKAGEEFEKRVGGGDRHGCCIVQRSFCT